MLTRIPLSLRRWRKAPTTREQRNVRRMLAFSALFGVVNGGALTFLPVFLVRLGASPMVASLFTSLPALLVIAFALPAGSIAARWRQPCRTSAWYFYAMRALYLPLIAAGWLGPDLAPALIVLVWGLIAIPATLGDMVFFDIVAEAIPARQRPAVNGLRWALLGLVSAVSVAAFGQFLERMPFPTNYQAVLFISMVVGWGSTTLYRGLEIPDREPSPSATMYQPWRKRLAELLRPLSQSAGFRRFLLLTSTVRLGLFLPAGLFGIFWVRELGASDAWVGWRATVQSVALTLGYYAWGRVVSRKGFPPVLMAACAGVGISLALSATATRETMSILLLTALIGGFFATGFDVSLFEWLLQVIPPAERPRYVAVNMALLNLVAFVAPLAGAAWAQHSGIRIVLVASGFCLLGSAALAGWCAKQRTPGPKAASCAAPDEFPVAAGKDQVS